MGLLSFGFVPDHEFSFFILVGGSYLKFHRISNNTSISVRLRKRRFFYMISFGKGWSIKLDISLAKYRHLTPSLDVFYRDSFKISLPNKDILQERLSQSY